VAGLDISGLAGTRLSGETLEHAGAQSGRVFVIEGQPLLDAYRTAGASIRLVVYAQPGSTVRVQTSPVVAPAGSWTDLQTLQLPDTYQAMDQLVGPQSAAFFRAIR
jgi:hypothetical protein